MIDPSLYNQSYTSISVIREIGPCTVDRSWNPLTCHFCLLICSPEFHGGRIWELITSGYMCRPFDIQCCLSKPSSQWLLISGFLLHNHISNTRLWQGLYYVCLDPALAVQNPKGEWLSKISRGKILGIYNIRKIGNIGGRWGRFSASSFRSVRLYNRQTRPDFKIYWHCNERIDSANTDAAE